MYNNNIQTKTDIAQAMSWSAQRFEEIEQNYFKLIFKNLNRIISLENSSLSLLTTNSESNIHDANIETISLFDKNCGADYLMIFKDKGIHILTSRMQRVHNKNGNILGDTFSIRFRRYDNFITEYEKRLRDIDNNYIRPFFNIIGFFSEKKDVNNNLITELESFCIIENDYLIKTIENKLKECNININTNTNDLFLNRKNIKNNLFFTIVPGNNIFLNIEFSSLENRIEYNKIENQIFFYGDTYKYIN